MILGPYRRKVKDMEKLHTGTELIEDRNQKKHFKYTDKEASPEVTEKKKSIIYQPTYLRSGCY